MTSHGEPHGQERGVHPWHQPSEPSRWVENCWGALQGPCFAPGSKQTLGPVLAEYIVRQKVYQTQYWKEHCFALTAETIIEKAVDLKAAGGTYGGARKPTNFMCLILKMLQIQPYKEVGAPRGRG